MGMGGETLSGTHVVVVKSGKTLRNRIVGPVTVSGVMEQEVLQVDSGAKVIDSKVYSGGFVYLDSGAVASGTHVISGGDQEVFKGSKAFGTVLSGSTAEYAGEDVYGVAKNTVVDSGGLSYAGSGGVISASMVEAGGFEYAFAHGKTVGARVGKNGMEGGVGILVSTTVSDGGYAYVSGTGVASASIIQGGGQEVIFKAATEKNDVIAGGDLVLNAVAKTAGTITFDGAGSELDVLGSKMPKAVLTDFTAGDEIKLVGVKYSKDVEVTVISAGLVVVTSGTKDFALHIAGAQIGQSSEFHFGPGSILTTTAPAMAFLAPAEAAAPVDLAGLAAAPGPAVAARAAAFGVSSATEGLVARDEWFGGKPAAFAVMSGHGGSW
jgi:autotransporter passenger strand-loop-strand repeat protein